MARERAATSALRVCACGLRLYPQSHSKVSMHPRGRECLPWPANTEGAHRLRQTASRPFWSRVGTCSAPRVMLGRPRLRLIVMPGTVTVALARPGHVTFPRCSSRTSWATGSPGATGPNLWGSNKGPPRLPEPPPPCDSFALSARSPDSAALIDHSRHGPQILYADWITTSRRC